MSKPKRVEAYYNHNLRFLKNILRNLVKWEGLPESIYEPALNDYLLWHGCAIGYKHKGEIIVAEGAIAGIDLYHRPTSFTVANPCLPSEKKTPRKDCCVCYNTTNYQYPETFNTLCDIYARRLAELDLSVDTSVKNSRVCLIPIVEDEKEAIRTARLIQEMYDGEPTALSYHTSFGKEKGELIFPIKARDNIVVSELADARRNILADFWSHLGVKTVAVDKKERTNLAEMSSNDTQLMLASDIILKPREVWCEEMNAMFGTNISVSLNEEEIEISMEGGNEDGNE